MPPLGPHDVAALADGVLRVGHRPAIELWLRAVWDLRPDRARDSGDRVTYRGAQVPGGLGVRFRGGRAIAAGPAAPPEPA